MYYKLYKLNKRIQYRQLKGTIKAIINDLQPITSFHLQQPILQEMELVIPGDPIDPRRDCPYLGTIKRHLIDFDLQQVCCVSLSNINIYGCLTCGRYYQGKGMSTPAFEHSIQSNHHLFINLSTTKIFCLPDNYQVQSHTLNDIKFNLQPCYKKQDLDKLYQYQSKYNIDGKEYIPGIIGMNNLNGTDYANATFQLLNAIQSFREYFLLKEHFEDPLLQKVSMLFKKIWNWQQFKGCISPHQIMQAITDRSNKVYKIGKKSDPANFIVWLVDNITRSLKKEKESFNPLSLFQGTIKTSYIKGIKNSAEYYNVPTKVETKPFTLIRLQFQERGIFNKIDDHVDIKDMMEYYLGKKGKIQGEGLLYMLITQFPRFLIIVFKRFMPNDYNVEKNTSQVIYCGNLDIQGHRYKLVGQICHQGTAEKGSYKAAVKHGEKWFEAQDLLIAQVLKKQMLLGQPYLQIYQKVS